MWKPAWLDRLTRKPDSFMAHLWCGLFLSVCGPSLAWERIVGGLWLTFLCEPMTWVWVAVVAGLCWEWGYWLISKRLLPATGEVTREYREWGAPDVSPDVLMHISMSRAGLIVHPVAGDLMTPICTDMALIQFFQDPSFDRRRPSKKDMVPFLIAPVIGICVVEFLIR